MKERLSALRKEAEEKVEQAKTPEELEKIKVAYLGKKGTITKVLRSMNEVPKEERPLIGRMAKKYGNLSGNKLPKNKKGWKKKRLKSN